MSYILSALITILPKQEICIVGSLNTNIDEGLYLLSQVTPYNITKLRRCKVWAEVEASPPNLLSYTNNILRIVTILLWNMTRYMANLNILYKIIVAYYISIS